VLIDAGVGETSHLDAIAAVCPGGPEHVIVTHGHSDHVLGVTAIAARWPQTTFSKFPWTAERDERHGVPFASLTDGQSVPAGDRVLEVVHTPGHAPDHVALWDAEAGVLFTGDLVVHGSTVVILASSGGSVAAYLHSLHRVLQLGPTRLWPAHGPAIDQPAAVLRKYIAHRRQREVQVLRALEHGCRTVDAIVSKVYTGLADPLIPMARESVLAHLIKLQDDGLARRRDDDNWMAGD